MTRRGALLLKACAQLHLKETPNDSGLSTVFLLSHKGVFRKHPGVLGISLGFSILVTWQMAAAAPIAMPYSIWPVGGKAKGKRDPASQVKLLCFLELSGSPT